MKKIAVSLCMLAALAAPGAAIANAPAETGSAAKADAKPLAPTRAELLARGQQIVGAVCVACHGIDGLSPIPANPNIAGMPSEYIAKQLELFKSGKRVNPVMQGMVANLTPADMQALGVYYFSQRAKSSAVARDKALAERGQKIYRAGAPEAKLPACAGCHGGAGAGIPALYPRLAGQWPEYTLQSLKAYASGARQHPQMTAITARLKESDMRAVAEYVAGMRSN
jgi:cytochrome c553